MLYRMLSRFTHKTELTGKDLRLILITSLAAGAGWLVGVLVNSPSPFIISLAALFSVQATAHATIKDAFSRVIATAVGVGLAVGLLHLFDAAAWGVILLVAASILTGRLLGMGSDGAMNVPGTALFIYSLGAFIPEGMVSGRILDTMLGAVVGVMCSFILNPKSPFYLSQKAVQKVSEDIGTLLSDLANAMSTNLEQVDAARFLTRSRKLETSLKDAEKLVAEAISAAKWSSKSKKLLARDLSRQLRSLDHSAEQANALARNLFDSLSDTKPTRLPDNISRVVSATADAFTANASEIRGASSTLAPALLYAQEARAESVDALRSMDDTGVWLLSGALLADVDKMTDQLARSAPALDLTPTAEQPIIPVMRQALTKALSKQTQTLRNRAKTRLSRKK